MGDTLYYNLSRHPSPAKQRTVFALLKLVPLCLLTGVSASIQISLGILAATLLTGLLAGKIKPAHLYRRNSLSIVDANNGFLSAIVSPPTSSRSTVGFPRGFHAEDFALAREQNELTYRSVFQELEDMRTYLRIVGIVGEGEG